VSNLDHCNYSPSGKTRQKAPVLSPDMEKTTHFLQIDIGTQTEVSLYATICIIVSETMLDGSDYFAVFCQSFLLWLISPSNHTYLSDLLNLPRKRTGVLIARK
jgi:hypothetical protein